MHGPKGMPRLTEYGTAFRTKQRLKRSYGLREKQFIKAYKEARVKRGDTGLYLLQFLERRLDNVIYRLGFAKTRAEARQKVSHAHILVNGKKVNIPSYRVKTGEIISIREKSKQSKMYRDLAKDLTGKNIPGWLYLDAAKFEGKIISDPDVTSQMETANVKTVVEFYSR